MPKQQLIFEREIISGQQEPISIETLRASGLGGDSESFTLQHLCRNFVLSEALQGDAPKMTHQMQVDAPRTDFWRIRNNLSIDTYLSILGAGLTPYYFSLTRQAGIPSDKINRNEIYIEKQSDGFFYEIITSEGNVREFINIENFKRAQAREVVALVDQIIDPLDHAALKPLLLAVLEDASKKNHIPSKVGDIENSLMLLTDHLPTQWFLLTVFEQRIIKAAKNSEATNLHGGLVSTLECQDNQKQLVRYDRLKTGYCVQDVLNEKRERTGVVIVDEITFVFGSVIEGSVHAAITDKQAPIIYLTRFFLAPVSATEVSVRIKDYTIIQQPSLLSLFLISEHPQFLGKRVKRGDVEMDLVDFLQAFADVICASIEKQELILESLPLKMCCDYHPKREQEIVEALQKASSVDLNEFYNAIILCKFAGVLSDQAAKFISTVTENSSMHSQDEISAYIRFKFNFRKENYSAEKLRAVQLYLESKSPSAGYFKKTELPLSPVVLSSQSSIQSSFLSCLCEEPSIADVLLPDSRADVASGVDWRACRANLTAEITKILNTEQPKCLSVLTGYTSQAAVLVDLMSRF